MYFLPKKKKKCHTAQKWKEQWFHWPAPILLPEEITLLTIQSFCFLPFFAPLLHCLMLKHTMVFVYILHTKWDSTLDFRGPGRNSQAKRKSSSEVPGPCLPVFSSCPQDTAKERDALPEPGLWWDCFELLFVKFSDDRCYMKCKDYFKSEAGSTGHFHRGAEEV